MEYGTWMQSSNRKKTISNKNTKKILIKHGPEFKMLYQYLLITYNKMSHTNNRGNQVWGK